jgi:hypothetical protein
MNLQKLQKLIGTVRTVYRIQNEKGMGPYRNDELLDGILKHHSLNLREFPIPAEDYGIRRYILSQEKCAFLSLHFLLNWFSKEEIKTMENMGYFITPVKAKITAIGEKQILITT